MFLIYQEEKVEHAETRLKLNEVVEKLEQALAEISNLRDQVEQQKVAQEKMLVTENIDCSLFAYRSLFFDRHQGWQHILLFVCKFI